MEKGRLRWRRVLVTMLASSLTIFLADELRRDFFKSSENTIVVDGEFKTAGTADGTQPDDNVSLANGTQPTTNFEGVQNLGFSELSIPPSKLSTGMLTIINDEHPADGSAANGTVSLLKYKNDFYSLNTDSVKLNEDTAEALNRMMEDYNTATGLSDFVVYGTNDTYTEEGSLCPEKFPESVTGNTVDLALDAYGDLIAFDGYDEEGWIVENCYKYGFIVRYPEGKEAQTGHDFCPWHLRYVGDVHAAVMGEKNLCLEEYVEFLKAYKFAKPFTYTCNDSEYEIYTSSAEGESATVHVPISGKYSLSGDNIDTYIITLFKN